MHQQAPTRSSSPAHVVLIIGALASLAAGAAFDARGADHVIHISIDGLHAGHFQSMITAGSLPNFARFKNEGAWTVNARTDYSHTNTLPNHTTMLTGRPVTQPTGMANTVHHGWTVNVDPAPSATLHNSGNPNVPYKSSTFDVVHDAGLTTAHFASKTKFVIYEQSYSSKLDHFYAEEDVPAMQSEMLAELEDQRFNYTFLHYANADDAGHDYGWGGTAWKSAVQTVDGYLGQLFDLVENDAVLAGRTAIVLSADHGGTGTAHSTASDDDNYTIPFMAWGVGVAHGDFYLLNSTSRTNPGTSRVTYTAAGQPIRNGDGGNLALSLLGLNAIPGSLINAAQNLRVAKPGDFNGDGFVNGGDLANWGTAYGAASLSSHAHGDADGDRDVDGNDFLLWQRLVAGGSPAAAAVPEPTSAAIGGVFCLAACLRRRRRATSPSR